MVNCICLVQEGFIPSVVQTALDKEINHKISSVLSCNIKITWINVKKNDGWTAGSESTTSVITLIGPQVDQSIRENILLLTSKIWTQHTGCHINEVIVSLIPNN